MSRPEILKQTFVHREETIQKISLIYHKLRLDKDLTLKALDRHVRLQLKVAI